MSRNGASERAYYNIQMEAVFPKIVQQYWEAEKNTNFPERVGVFHQGLQWYGRGVESIHEG